MEDLCLNDALLSMYLVCMIPSKYWVYGTVESKWTILRSFRFIGPDGYLVSSREIGLSHSSSEWSDLGDSGILVEWSPWLAQIIIRAGAHLLDPVC